jgi:hypothetical protein
MNKDLKVMKQMQKKYKFVGDKTKTFKYLIDAENQDMTAILDQFKKMDRLKLPEYYESEDEPFWKVSNKLAASNFHQNVTHKQD